MVRRAVETLDPNRVPSYYDKVAGKFLKHRYRSRFWEHIARCEQDFVHEHISHGSNVLEIGPGPGFFTQELVKHARCVTAVDVSENMLEVLRHRVTDSNFRTVLLNVKQLDHLEEYGKYDTVVCMRVLSHLDEIETALEKIQGALLPGGNAIFDLFNNRALLLLIRRLRKTRSSVLTRYYEFHNMQEAIARAGLQVQDKQGWGYPNLGPFSLNKMGYRIAPQYAYSIMFNVTVR